MHPNSLTLRNKKISALSVSRSVRRTCAFLSLTRTVDAYVGGLVIFLRPTCATGIFASDVVVLAVDITAATIIFISNLIYMTAVIVFIIIIHAHNRMHSVNVILLVCVLRFHFVKYSKL
jgi:hypothetical protein